MSYSRLYAFAQNFDKATSRTSLLGATLKLTGIPKISHLRTTLDLTVSRGFYLSAKNTNERFVEQFGGHVIATGRGLNYCWERFVYVKELMHSFDDKDKSTDSGERFDLLLTELSGPGSPERSPQFTSEIESFWMALGVPCPETLRTKLIDQRRTKTDYEIALSLRIPERYVVRLFDRAFERNIANLIK